MKLELRMQHCGWCSMEGGGHRLDCQRPIVSNPIGVDRTWRITLNEYQRNNLMWLLNACGYGEEAIEPFGSANTGDWLGEIAIMLEHPEHGESKLLEEEPPNLSREDLKKEIDRWATVAQVMLR